MRTVLLALALTACSSPSTSATEPTPAPSTSATEPAPAPSTSATEPAPPPASPSSTAVGTPGPGAPVRLSAPACGYGGSATAVAVFVDLESDVAISGLTGLLVATDPATGARIGGSTPPISLYEVPRAHPLTDFSTSGTTPFGGSIAAGWRGRLLFFSGLDGLPPGMGPIDLELQLRDAAGTVYVTRCTTDTMWPSS